MAIGQLKLPTKSVDNSVEEYFLTVVTSGFYWSFVNLNTFYAAQKFYLFSMCYYIIALRY